MNMFIPLFHDDDDLENVEGIIRSDSIVEVWFNNATYSITIRYRAPIDGHIVDKDEYYNSFQDANKRYFQIASHIVDDYAHFNDIRSEKCQSELLKKIDELKML